MNGSAPVANAVVAPTDSASSAGSAGNPAPRSRWLGRLGVALLPVAVFVVLGVRSLEPINGQDGYLYIGMVARLEDFLARFPDAYYGMRFGYTLPSVVFARVFGFEVGHHLLRFALLGLVCLQLRAASSLSWRYRALAAVLFCASPLVLVSTFSTYPMSIGALSFTAGALLLARDDTTSNAAFGRLTLGGMALAVAWNCHLVALVPAIAVCFVAIADRVRLSPSRQRTAVRSIAFVGAGTLLVVGTGVAVLWLRYGISDVYGPTLRQAERGASEQFRYDGLEWLGFRHYLLVVPISACVSLFVWRTEEGPSTRTSMRRLALMNVAVTCVYGWFQWARREPLLEMYYHSGPLLLLAVATLSISIATVLRRFARSRWYVFPLVLSLVIVCSYAGSRVSTSFVALAVITGALAGLTLLARARGAALQSAAVALFVGVAAWSSVSSPHDFPPTPGGYRVDPNYDIALFAYDGTSMERATILDRLSRSLPSLPRTRGQVMMWFDPLGPYDQMSAPFLWYLSGALQAPSDPPPPFVSQAVMDHALVARPRFIVVLDDDQRAVAQAAASLVDLAEYEYRWAERFTSGRTTLEVVLLERRAGTWSDFPCAGVDDLPAPCGPGGGVQLPQVESSDQNVVSP